MSAESIELVTLAIQNPEFFDTSQDRWTELPANVSFQYDLEDSIRTLSTTGAPSNDDISGLLYVPTLNTQQQVACLQASNSSWIPHNATHRADLPVNYELIALVPWLNKNCTLAFLEAASADLLAAMLFYIPPPSSNVSSIASTLNSSRDGGGNGTETPPLDSDPVWDLGDGGSWKSKYNFPVYAVPSSLGVLWMQQLAAYSGNMTQVPEGKELGDLGLVGPTDYVRLMADISTGGGSHIPSLWVFLLIVLALLIVIIAFTSGLMHFVARQRRSILRRRIANGEIDLEALGIKRLMVPREVLDEMPLYPYNIAQASAPATLATHNRSNSEAAKTTANISVSVLSAPRASRQQTELQTTCAICLDDFTESQPSPSMVRELPCGHIFHAECVDPFLTTHSSLCPLCKKSSLPVGYVPKTITNTMVRRERQVRRLRGRGIRVRNGGSEDIVRASVLNGHGREERSLVERVVDGGLHVPVPPRIRTALSNGRRVFSAPAGTTQRTAVGGAREMQEIHPTAATAESPAPVTGETTGVGPAAVAPPSQPPTTTTEEADIEPTEQDVREGPSAARPLTLEPVASGAEPSRRVEKTWWKGVAGRIFPRSG
ncbi:hypothetical protein NA57DRAFT_73792 [Rhizodiscina lignyota]|uniref:RING-type domain-containing protein n=1 Tax=Rhizodiscina lignyota TaxID=1504668 RepID=A0A9P4MBZ1_9PEZI|nr:hypothetical protein NA57DRAFT_73792 [Rhizodiscina lignyota]